MQDYVLKLVAESLAEGSGKGGAILIVEDEAIVRESLRDWLKEKYEVCEAGTGEDASELIGRRDFDVLIADVRLPGKSGLDLLKEVQSAKPYIKFVVITAYPSVELAVQAMKEGAVEYLVKPIEAEKLEGVIQRIISKQTTPRGKEQVL